MFVDASAIVAILLDETDGRELAMRLEAADAAFTSPIAIYEATLAVSREHKVKIPLAESRVRRLASDAGVVVSPIGDEVASLALVAQAKFGKRSGHPARLNMGDCFAYAMARQHNVPLLYKGDDFALTDLA